MDMAGIFNIIWSGKQSKINIIDRTDSKIILARTVGSSQAGVLKFNEHGKHHKELIYDGSKRCNSQELQYKRMANYQAIPITTDPSAEV